MRLAVYAHPFDLTALDRRGGLRRLADLGFAEIALAVAYHDGRWLQPWNPGARVRFLEDGVVHFRPTGRYERLVPLPSSCVPETGPSPWQRCCEEAAEVGMSARAWTVLTHNSRLGTMHPDLCVENAFGDRYRYALCPAQPEVQHYVCEVTEDIARRDGAGSLELEAFGWMGHRHGSHHDKASFAVRGALGVALSLCFCEVCREAARGRGGDPEAARRWARETIVRCVERGDAMAPDDGAVLDSSVDGMRRSRTETLGTLGVEVGRRIPDGVDLALQIHPDPLFSGSQLPAEQGAACPASEFVLTAYGEGPDGIGAMLRADGMAAVGDRPIRLSIWPRAPQFRGDGDLAQVRELCARHGVSTLAIYHLGLLPWATLERVAAFFSR